MPQPVRLLIGTKKGAWTLSSPDRRRWTLSKPLQFGNEIHHFVQDPRDAKRAVMTVKAGHLGPTIARSSDGGRKWVEAKQPPAFEKAPEGQKGRTVQHVFWLTPGHASEPGVWYAGTAPQALFRSEDHGDTWTGVEGFNNHPMRSAWCGGDQDATPDGPRMHSILVDPRDANHMYLGMSGGGFFESTDKGADWKPLNQGCAADFIPTPDPEYGHDPHCVRYAPTNPDRLYMQNHCGIYRLDRPATRWERIGKKMPKKIGDIGFGVAIHPRDADTAWVIPMDGTMVWPRTAIDGKPAVYVTRNAGKSWTRQDKGFPEENAWWTVYRQALTIDQGTPAGLYFGNTSGELWASRDEGASWKNIARHLPRILSVEVAL